MMKNRMKRIVGIFQNQRKGESNALATDIPPPHPHTKTLPSSDIFEYSVV
jgi:hypothetical protein